MNSQAAKTDNSHFVEKVILRCQSLPKKKEIKVLDCFAGSSKLWEKVKELKGSKSFDIVNIEKKRQEGIYLKGDNRKFIKGMNLNKFDVVDLDAYGVPYEQLDSIFEKQFDGVIIVTFIQSIFGKLPKKLLYHLGYTKKMIDKCPTLFDKNGLEKFEEYLALNGVRKIKIITENRKHYLSFNRCNP